MIRITQILAMFVALSAHAQPNRQDPTKAIIDGVDAALSAAKVAATCEIVKSSYYASKEKYGEIIVEQPDLTVECKSYKPPVLSWEVTEVNGAPAVSYRVVITDGSTEVMKIETTDTTAIIYLTRLTGLTVIVEALDEMGNGVFFNPTPSNDINQP